MANPPIKLVAFDLFGTLIEMLPFDEFKANLFKMAGLLGVDPKQFAQAWHDDFSARMRGQFGDHEGAIAEILGRFQWKAAATAITKAAQLKHAYMRRSIRIRNDVLHTLAALKARDIRIALVTDCSCDIPRIWESLPIAPYFDALVFSCSEGVRKPDIRMYFQACIRAGIEPENTVYVGDGGSHELSGAMRFGMHPILIETGLDSQFLCFRPDAVGWTGPRIRRISEVLHHV